MITVDISLDGTTALETAGEHSSVPASEFIYIPVYFYKHIRYDGDENYHEANNAEISVWFALSHTWTQTRAHFTEKVKSWDTMERLKGNCN